MGTALVLLILIVAVVLIVRGTVRDKKRGGGCGGCTGCRLHDRCPHFAGDGRD